MVREGKIRFDTNEFSDPFVALHTRNPDAYSNAGLKDIQSCLDRIYGSAETNLADFPPRPQFWALFNSADFSVYFEQFYCTKYEKNGIIQGLEKEIRLDYAKLEKIPSKNGALSNLVAGVVGSIVGAIIGSEYDRPILGAVMGSTIGTVGNIVAGRRIFEAAQKSHAALEEMLDIPLEQAIINMRTQKFAQEDHELQEVIYNTIRDHGY